MNTVLWLIAGAILGWIGYTALGLNEAIGKMAPVILGAVSGVFGGKVIAPLFAGAILVPDAFSLAALFFAAATSATILVATHMGLKRWWP